jgi:hypothetical protein
MPATKAAPAVKPRAKKPSGDQGNLAVGENRARRKEALRVSTAIAV